MRQAAIGVIAAVVVIILAGYLFAPRHGPYEQYKPQLSARFTFEHARMVGNTHFSVMTDQWTGNEFAVLENPQGQITITLLPRVAK